LSLGSGNSDVATALAANPTHTIVVFTGGSACIAGTWSTAPGVVIALYPGQEQGYAMADVLFGDHNPSGKLPITFPQDENQVPNFRLVNYNLAYPAADTAHGYFRANKMGYQPLFAFGHGLSYTTFEYSNLAIYPETITAGDRVTVQVDVTNSGSVAGEEVAQLYLSQPSGQGVPVRVQDLRGFRKVALAPQETKTVQYTLTFNDMAYFDDNGTTMLGDGSWQVLPGTYGVRVGTSSEILREPTVTGSFSVQ
jgi:beta-glucosidase